METLGIDQWANLGSTGFLIAILVYALRKGGAFVEVLMTNHLKHIEEHIRELAQETKELRKELREYNQRLLEILSQK